MLRCVEKWAPSNKADSEIFAAIGVLCQSSGHGKSRCIKEFSQTHFSIIINLASESENVFPLASKISEEFLLKMKSQNTATIYLYQLIDSVLDQISASQLSVDKFNKSRTTSSSVSTLMSSQPSSSAANKVSDLNMLISNKFKTILGNLPLFVFFDEANSLLENSNEFDQSSIIK